MSIYEALMLIAFGVSWPMAIVKTYRAKNPAGKSLVFSILIILGYLAGIMHKLTVSLDWVIWLYVLNEVMVSADLILVLYYRSRARTARKNR